MTKIDVNVLSQSNKNA